MNAKSQTWNENIINSDKAKRKDPELTKVESWVVAQIEQARVLRYKS